MLSLGIGVVHSSYGISSGVDIYPRRNGFSETMTETLSYLGHEPVISLTISGFKVAEHTIKQNKDDLCQPIV